MASKKQTKEEVELYNDEVCDIVSCIQDTCCNSTDPAQRNEKLKSLLVELEEYTQPLIQDINSLSFDEQHLILCRVARVLPEVIQKEIDAIRRKKMPQNNSGNNNSKTEILFDAKLRNETLLRQNTIGDPMNSSIQQSKKQKKWRIGLQNRRASITTLLGMGNNKKSKDDNTVVDMEQFAPHLNHSTQLRALRRRVRLLCMECKNKMECDSLFSEDSNSFDDDQQLLDDDDDDNDDTCLCTCTNDNGNDNEETISNINNNKIKKTNTICPTCYSDISDVSTKEDLNKILNRLGYEDFDELYRHSKPAQLFGEYVNAETRRKESEKAKSARVEMQLAQWKHVQIGDAKHAQTERRNSQLMKKSPMDGTGRMFSKLLLAPKKNTKQNLMKNKNTAKKVMMMIGVDQVASETDMHAIMKASSKALKKL